MIQWTMSRFGNDLACGQHPGFNGKKIQFTNLLYKDIFVFWIYLGSVDEAVID